MAVEASKSWRPRARGTTSVGRRSSRSVLRKRTLEDTLLTDEERAAFEAIDRGGTQDDSEPISYRMYYCVATYCCNKATFALLTMTTILLIGVALLTISSVATDKLKLNESVRGNLSLAGSYVVSAGLFGLLGGFTNLLALLMLFYEIPLIYGTGVMQRQHRQIGNIICRIVIQMLFDSEHLKNYILERISKFSVDVNIMESIAKGLNSNKAGVIIDNHLNDLYNQPESQYLVSLGISRSQLEPMIRPAILSLCAETAPFALTHDTEEHTVSIPKLRDAIAGFLVHRAQTLSKTVVSNLMKQLLFQHLIGLIMYGCIMGCMVGLLAQALRISLNPGLGRG